MFDDAVVIALGGNLPGEFGSIEALLEAAVLRLEGAGFKVVSRSAWWRSASWPDPTRPSYLNGVVIVETPLGPAETLAELRRIEAAFGRRRGEANAPRTLDLDLIAHGRTVIDDDGLVIPHPRAAERRFVMGPLAEIAPDWRHPASGRLAEALASEAGVGRDAHPIDR
jgi:2-amino-4-hydroxy-6-hydroxymethyldihydropteridine diphosphokinase